MKRLWLFLLFLPVLGATAAATPPPPVLHYFQAANCPHCQEAAPKLAALLKRYPTVELRRYDVWEKRADFELLRRLGSSAGQPAIATPAITVGGRLWFGYSEQNAREIEATLRDCLADGCPDAVAALAGPAPPPTAATTITPPPGSRSLPLLTVSLALLDSFNPCAFFVLIFLLSLLVHVHSQRAMWLVGGTFVACSGIVYFLFMAAWLNLFLLAGHLRWLTAAAGGVALLVAALNIKDYFYFHLGPSLSIPEGAKPGLFSRMRALVRGKSLPALLGGTLVLAVIANGYELLCTAGFPMVYTRALTMQQLDRWSYYGWLALYNLIYILPLFAIVTLFAVTLGHRKLSEEQGRLLKLLSGTMMLLLALLLLVAPQLLTSVWVSASLLPGALLLAAALVAARRYVALRHRHGEG